MREPTSNICNLCESTDVALIMTEDFKVIFLNNFNEFTSCLNMKHKLIFFYGKIYTTISYFLRIKGVYFFTLEKGCQQY